MTQVFYQDVSMVDGQPKTVEKELEFVQWTTHYLFVKYPYGSIRSGQEWRMGRALVNYWLQIGKLRLEGDIPEWALIV